MKLQKRIVKDYKDIQRKANALFQVAALNIGKIIEKAGQDVIQTIAMNLSLHPSIDYASLASLGTFDRIERLVELRLKHAASDVAQQWTYHRENFPILARTSMSFIARKASPPWVSVKLNLKDKVDSARDGIYDPRMGHIQFYFDKMADQVIAQMKQGALNQESLHDILERIRPLFLDKSTRRSKEAAKPPKIEETIYSRSDETTPAEKIDVEEGHFTLEDVQGFIEDLRAANNWEYRQYKPWFTDSIKRRNSFLSQLEQALMSDAMALLHDNQLQIGPKEMGIKDFTWIAAYQEKTCEFCGKRHEMSMKDIKRTLKDKYKDLPPPLHPHCNCQLVPRISDDWAESQLKKDDMEWDSNEGLTYKAGKDAEYGAVDMTYDEFMDKFAR